MKGVDQVRQDHLWLHGRKLIERSLPQIAVQYLLIPISFEVSVARIRLAQHIVGEGAIVAIRDAPVVRIGSLSIDRLEVYVEASRLLIVCHKVIRTCILKEVCQVACATHHVPVAAVQFTAKHLRTWQVIGDQSL